MTLLFLLSASNAIPPENLGNFMTVLLLTFSIFMILAGAFTSYFGTGKSRVVGVILLVVGIIVAVAWLAVASVNKYTDPGLADVIWGAFLSIVAAIIGAVVAVFVFLFAIMKT
jgi:MFS family permease